MKLIFVSCKACTSMFKLLFENNYKTIKKRYLLVNISRKAFIDKFTVEMFLLCGIIYFLFNCECSSGVFSIFICIQIWVHVIYSFDIKLIFNSL